MLADISKGRLRQLVHGLMVQPEAVWVGPSCPTSCADGLSAVRVFTPPSSGSLPHAKARLPGFHKCRRSAPPAQFSVRAQESLASPMNPDLPAPHLSSATAVWKATLARPEYSPDSQALEPGGQ